MPATKHTQNAQSMKMECDYLNGWIKKKIVTYAKISHKMVNLRDTAGNTEEEEDPLWTGSNPTCCLDISLIPLATHSLYTCGLHLKISVRNCQSLVNRVLGSMLATRSTKMFPKIPTCPGIYTKTMSFLSHIS